jgi:hypothetical protein
MSETLISPVRQRMIEDMTVRNLGAATSAVRIPIYVTDRRGLMSP